MGTWSKMNRTEMQRGKVKRVHSGKEVETRVFIQFLERGALSVQDHAGVTWGQQLHPLCTCGLPTAAVRFWIQHLSRSYQPCFANLVKKSVPFDILSSKSFSCLRRLELLSVSCGSELLLTRRITFNGKRTISWPTGVDSWPYSRCVFHY